MSRQILLVDIGSGLTLLGELPTATVDAYYTFQLLGFGGSGSYRFALVSGGTTGIGLSVDGVVYGYALAAGDFPMEIELTDTLTTQRTRRTLLLRARAPTTTLPEPEYLLTEVGEHLLSEDGAAVVTEESPA
jgi:hypothetical protein